METFQKLKMIFYTCLILSLIGGGSSLRCRWVDHKFQQLSSSAIQCLNEMANTSLNESDNSDMVLADFPHHLYVLQSTATDEHRLHFVVQVLDEVAKLFLEDYSSAAWGEVTLDHFLQSVTQQANGLRLCYQHSKRKNRRLHAYFKRLALDLQQMEYSAAAWEMVRAALKLHLFRVQLLVQPLMAGQ